MYTLFLCFLAVMSPIRTEITDIPVISEAPFPHENPEASLDALIAVTEENLIRMKRLGKQIHEYQELHSRYSVDTNNKPLGEKLIYRADSVKETIEELHIKHLFDDEFLHELTFFSNIAKKWKKNPRSH